MLIDAFVEFFNFNGLFEATTTCKTTFDWK